MIKHFGMFHLALFMFYYFTCIKLSIKIINLTLRINTGLILFLMKYLKKHSNIMMETRLSLKYLTIKEDIFIMKTKTYAKEQIRFAVI